MIDYSKIEFYKLSQAEDNQLYNEWRRDITVLYVCLTGRTTPNIRRDSRYSRRLIELWDYHPGTSPMDALDVLVTEGIVQVA